MPFKVKNLMVSVLPQDAALQQTNLQVQWTGTIFTTGTIPWTTTFTTFTTIPTFPTNCLISRTITIPTCGISKYPTFSYACGGPIDLGDIEVLTGLRAELDTQIEALNVQLSLKTVEEAELLEKHLTEALSEVKATKEALRKASK